MGESCAHAPAFVCTLYLGGDRKGENTHFILWSQRALFTCVNAA